MLSRRRGGTCRAAAAGIYTLLSARWRVPGTRRVVKMSDSLVAACPTR
jgi:hypothetical protein